MPFNLAAYLQRVGLDPDAVAEGRAGASAVSERYSLLRAIMAAHSRTIPFENIDVVLGKRVSMADANVEAKLVGARRGGYCFEQNTLLRQALEALDYGVRPLLCRVRWGKRPETLTTFTHVALAVAVSGDESEYLVDVGFAGTNSVAPIRLSTVGPQAMPEGHFRVVTGVDHVGLSSAGPGGGYTGLEMHNRGEWKCLYVFRTEETAIRPDLEMSNWISCTGPAARFTNQFFCCIVVGDTMRYHILNNKFVVRTLAAAEGTASTVEETEITSAEQLVTLLRDVFGISFGSGAEGPEGLDRYLSAA